MTCTECDICEGCGYCDRTAAHYDACTDDHVCVDQGSACKENVALQLGRDCMRMGLIPFLERLVGPENTDRLFARHAGEED